MTVEKKVVDLNVEPTPQVNREPVEDVQEQQVVEEVQATQPEPGQEAQVAAETPPVIPVQPVADVDEFGVPWKNRAMEYKRKNEEVIERLPQLIEEKLKTVTQPQTPQYTYEQLEAYKLQNSSDPQVVAWATGEQRKMQLAENRKLFEEVTGTRERAREFEAGRQQAFETVKQKYPDALVQGSPMFNLVAQYMRIPEFANRPDGLSWAAKMARADLLESQAPVLQKKTEQLKAEVKQAQKASLTEGAGRRVTVSSTPVQSALEGVRKSGSLRDAEAAIGAILRQKGIIGE